MKVIQLILTSIALLIVLAGAIQTVQVSEATPTLVYCDMINCDNPFAYYPTACDLQCVDPSTLETRWAFSATASIGHHAVCCSSHTNPWCQ